MNFIKVTGVQCNSQGQSKVTSRIEFNINRDFVLGIMAGGTLIMNEGSLIQMNSSTFINDIKLAQDVRVDNL